MTTDPSPLTESHVRQLRRIGGFMIVAIPCLLYGWAFGAHAYGWDVVETARASAVCLMLVLATCNAAPLFLRHSPDARRRGFVVFWFSVATFFNVTWQIPLIVFRSTITTAAPTSENLLRFIPWWGYGFADAHYGRVSAWMISEELWWLLAIAISVVGLVLLRRGRDARAFVLLGVAGALEAYNASLYIVENALVDRFANIPEGSTLSLLLYWGFNPLWAIAALAASVFSFQFVLRAAERE
jgi:hypothetical protein